MKTYGDQIKEAREVQSPKMSRRRLAEKLGLSETHLRGIESNERETKPQVLRRCAITLGIDEKKLIAAWLQQNLEGIEIEGLTSQLPQGVSLTDLKEVYDIEEAKNLSAECRELGGSDISVPKTAIKLRRALQNCVDFIGELERAAGAP